MDRVSPSRGFVEPEMELLEPEMELLLLFDGISGIDSKGWKFEAAELVEFRGQCQLKVEPMREPSEKKYRLGKDYYIDGQNTQLIFLKKCSLGEGSKAPKLQRGWIFWTMIFYSLKNSGQVLSNGGSIFILSSVEVGH